MYIVAPQESDEDADPGTARLESSTICDVCHCEVHDDGVMSGLQLHPGPEATDDAAMLGHLHHTAVQRGSGDIQVHGLKHCCIQWLRLSFCYLLAKWPP